ncbi:MAG: ParA family protein [Bacillota bacterium]|nr:MAG: ParA family protein [Bacillota bacterium]
MGKVIAFANQKGGVGKTTTSVNLGACLAELGKRLLIVDLDPQGHVSSGLGIEKSKISRCMYDVIISGLPLREIIVPTAFANLWVAPSTIDLAGAELELVPAISRETRLRDALADYRDDYDFLFVDCPPSLGLLTVNALTAADAILVPIQCEYYALEGLSQLMNTIHLVRTHLNPDLQLEGVLLTMYDSRTNLSAEVEGEVKKYFREKVYETIIPRTVRLSEAPSHGLPIIAYDPKSKGAEVYMALAREVSDRA